ncbi:hypothetical protein [Singulisphaera sp. PoT]|uniref:hypothetical protein n=1 Tax=Singulisphaera sp. PoT TaxID=3411797 RepID=UPI003BF5194D
MRMERLIDRTAWGVALFLGQVSVLWGVMISLGWAFGFVLLVSSKSEASALHPMHLSVAPPLMGLAAAGLALLIAQKSRSAVWHFALAGIVFNTIALILALVQFTR